MKIFKQRWRDDQVLYWAYEYLNSGKSSLKDLERRLQVPDSTLSWCFNHRLPRLDKRYYEEVIKKLIKNSKRIYNK